jgi:GNAT superfamily N-acetyltransferase
VSSAAKLILRAANEADLPAIRILIAASVRQLQPEYTQAQREAALASVFTPDTQLIADRTYFVIDADDSALAACGGWSWRSTLYGGDHHAASRNAQALDTAHDAARIRAFFVHSSWARHGLGSRLLAACEQAAWQYGFRRAELGATLSGVPFYTCHGYGRREDIRVALPQGQCLDVVRMAKQLGATSTTPRR